MIQWVSNERSTITKLVEHGRLWIVDKNCRHIAYQSTMLGKFLMKRGGTLNKLIRRWGPIHLCLMVTKRAKNDLPI